MDLVALSVFDKKSEIFHPPFFVRSVHDGRRVFQQMVSDSSMSLSQTPGDFDLMQVGSFTDTSGSLVPVSPFPFVCNGASLVP